MTNPGYLGPASRRRFRRRGAAVVEFALTFPILIALVVGLLEFVRLSHLRHAGDTAAYEAARFVMVPGATASEAVTQATDLLRRAGVRRSTVTVTPTTIVETTPEITVQVTVPLQGNSWLPPTLTKSRTIVRRVTLMTERPGVVQAQGGGS